MSILKIYTYPDEVLKQMAQPISDFNAELEKLASDMLDTMYDAPGVGLAANQVGILKRIVVIDVDYDIDGEEEKIRKYSNQNPLIIINPEIKTCQGEFTFKEGCLSVPGFSEEVKRSKKLTLRYQDLKGKFHELEADGLLTVAIQHEIDQLNGKLFIDRLSVAKRGLIKGKIKKERGATFERSRFHVEL